MQNDSPHHPTAIQTTKSHGQGIGGSCYFDGE